MLYLFMEVSIHLKICFVKSFLQKSAQNISSTQTLYFLMINIGSPIPANLTPSQQRYSPSAPRPHPSPASAPASALHRGTASDAAAPRRRGQDHNSNCKRYKIGATAYDPACGTSPWPPLKTLSYNICHTPSVLRRAQVP